jgi:hypothetical protein
MGNTYEIDPDVFKQLERLMRRRYDARLIPDFREAVSHAGKAVSLPFGSATSWSGLNR